MATAAAVTLRYPNDLASQSADWVKFEFFKYEGAFKDGGGGSSDPYLNNYSSVALSTSSDCPSIALYMPEDVSGNYAANWGGRDFSPMGAALLKTTGNFNSATDQSGLEAGVKSSIASIDSMKSGLMPWFAAKAIQAGMNGLPGFGGNVSQNDVLASTQGKILNPNTEVLYTGAQLRTFGLTFKLSARNKGESEDIRNICNTFKRAMLPRKTDATQVLVQVPNIVQVTFMSGTNKNKWVSQFKQCAIGSVDINTTPDGTWSTFNGTGGAPTAVQLGLQFQELKILFADEITDTNYY